MRVPRAPTCAVASVACRGRERLDLEVEVEVRHDDVAHVPRREAQALEVAERGAVRVEAEAQRRGVQRRQPRPGPEHVAEAEAGGDTIATLMPEQWQAVVRAEMRGRLLDAADADGEAGVWRVVREAMERPADRRRRPPPL